MRTTAILVWASCIAVPMTGMSADSPQNTPTRSDASIERAVDSILARLTLEQKIGQLVQNTSSWTDSLTGPGSGAQI